MKGQRVIVEKVNISDTYPAVDVEFRPKLQTDYDGNCYH